MGYDLDSDTFELELTDMAHGGSALGRYQKRIIFVPYTIPGERIRARIVQDKGRIAFAEGVELLDSSMDRVYPRCPHFGPGRCGRCQWQHIDYPAQLLLKQDVLADQLARIGGLDDAILEAALQPVLPSPEQWGYNYHMTLDADAEGKLGFSVEGRTYPITECHLLHPALLDLFNALDLDAAGLRETLRRVTLRLDSDAAPMLILAMNDDQPPELEIDLPASVNLLLSDHQAVNLIGDLFSQYAIAGRTFRVSAGSVFRANVAQIETVVREVLTGLDLQGNETVLDLYGGVGLFSAFLVGHAAHITLVDSYPAAIADAQHNLTGIDAITILENTVENALLESPEIHYDAAVLDPPPEGLSVSVMDALGERAIPRLVYVSSDPAVLARDAKRLAPHGYRLVHAQPIDLAPQTYFIDTVAVFTR